MATTTKGIYYPNNYLAPADIPNDMKDMAESIDVIFGNYSTTEHVDELIGDINSALDSINGEVV